MGQQHGQPAQSAPFVLPTGNKLIDHHLSAVGEITKLGFPHHEAAWGRGGIAIFERQHRLLREQRIIDPEGRLLRAQLLQGNIGLTVALTVKHRVPVTKSPAPHVLPRQANGVALFQ